MDKTSRPARHNIIVWLRPRSACIMTTRQLPSYFEVHHITFQAATGQVLHATNRHTGVRDHPHAYDTHNSTRVEEDEKVLARALADLQGCERGAHQRATRQLRKLTRKLPMTSPLRAVGCYFLGVCYEEGRGCSRR